MNPPCSEVAKNAQRQAVTVIFIAFVGNFSKVIRQYLGVAKIDVGITERKLVLQASSNELRE